MKKTGLGAALAVLMLVWPVLPVFAGQEVVEDGVLHVMNGSEPDGEKVVVNLEEAWRHGGEDDEDFFGMISQCVVGDDGTIYLLDTRKSEVPVYSPEGERLATLSREGDGPGETRIPSGLLFMPDGNLGLVQVFPGKITLIDTEGTPAGVIEIGDATEGGFLQMFDCVVSGDHLVIAAETIGQDGPTAQNRNNFVASVDGKGHEIVRYYENTSHWDFMNFTFDEGTRNRVDYRKVAAGPDGRVYVASERNAYRINVYASDGSLERVIEREFVSRPRRDEDVDKLKTIMEAQFAQLPGAKIIVGRTEPDISGLVFGRDGNLWVTTSRSGFEQPEGIMTSWDVFTPDGDFIRTVSARCEGDGENDILIWTPRGNAVMVTGFTEALEALQSRGAGGEDEEEEDAAPMEVVYLKAVNN